MSANTLVHTCMKSAHMHFVLCVNGVTTVGMKTDCVKANLQHNGGVSLHDSFQKEPEPRL